MKLKYFILFLILNSYFFSFSQINIDYEISNPSNGKKFYKRLGKVTKLKNGNYLIIKRFNMFVDVFNQELQIISPKNEILKTKEIKNSLVLTAKRINGKTFIFSIDNSGNFKVSELNITNLNIINNPITLTRLIIRKKKSKKVRHFLFPEVIFSDDNSKFALIQRGKSKEDKTLFINILVYNKDMELVYEKEVKTQIPKYSFELKSAILSNSGEIYLAGLIDYNQIQIFSINKDNTKTYNKTIESKIDFSNLSYENNKLTFFSITPNEENKLYRIDYNVLDKNLNQNKINPIPFNLEYPKNSNIKYYPSLEIHYENILQNGNTILIAEYNESEYNVFSKGSLILLVVNKEKTACIYSKVILKNQSTQYTFYQGFVPFEINNKIYLFFNEEGTSYSNYKVVKVDIESNKIDKKTLFNREKIGVTPFANTDSRDEIYFNSRVISIYQKKSSFKVDENSFILFTDDSRKIIKIKIND